MKGIKRRTLDRQPRRALPLSVAVLSRLNAYLYSGLCFSHVDWFFSGLLVSFLGDRSLRIWRTIWRVNVMFRCLLRWDDMYRLKVIIRFSFICFFKVNFPFHYQVTDFEYQADRNAYRFMLQGGKTAMYDTTPYRYSIFPFTVFIFIVILILFQLFVEWWIRHQLRGPNDQTIFRKAWCGVSWFSCPALLSIQLRQTRATRAKLPRGDSRLPLRLELD